MRRGPHRMDLRALGYQALLRLRTIRNPGYQALLQSRALHLQTTKTRAAVHTEPESTRRQELTRRLKQEGQASQAPPTPVLLYLSRYPQHNHEAWTHGPRAI